MIINHIINISCVVQLANASDTQVVGHVFTPRQDH